MSTTERHGQYVIKRSRLRRRFYVVTIGPNGEPLATSELLNTRAACHVNIAAQVQVARSGGVRDESR